MTKTVLDENKGRILWVDDEVDRLRPHTIMLMQAGYHVDAVMNGNDALALLEAERSSW